MRFAGCALQIPAKRRASVLIAMKRSATDGFLTDRPRHPRRQTRARPSLGTPKTTTCAATWPAIRRDETGPSKPGPARRLRPTLSRPASSAGAWLTGISKPPSRGLREGPEVSRPPGSEPAGSGRARLPARTMAESRYSRRGSPTPALPSPVRANRCQAGWSPGSHIRTARGA
jgi:hypothetical protein